MSEIYLCAASSQNQFMCMKEMQYIDIYTVYITEISDANLVFE